MILSSHLFRRSQGNDLLPWTHSTFRAVLDDLRSKVPTYPYPPPRASKSLQIRCALPVCLLWNEKSGFALTCSEEQLDKIAIDIVQTFSRTTKVSMTIVYCPTRGWATLTVTDMFATRRKRCQDAVVCLLSHPIWLSISRDIRRLLAKMIWDMRQNIEWGAVRIELDPGVYVLL